MSRTAKVKIIITIVCISFLQGLQYGVSPILGQISAHYPNVSVSLVQMLVTAPALLSVIVSITSGFLVLKITKKKLLIFGGLIAGITGFLPFLADSFWLLFFARFLYGVGLGLATTLNVAVVAEFFEGDERVQVMGIQAASVGAGMVITTTVAGMLGTNNFTNAYYINVIAFVATILIAFCLPETGTAKETKTEKIRLNKEVLTIDLFGILEYLFLITFSTNIAMHLSGTLAGDTAASGTLTGIFSGVQIVMGIILGAITKITGKYTMPAAMLSFSVGAVFLVFFSGSLPGLAVGAIFCGMSQGIFVPTAVVAVSNAVPQVATAMASASFTCAMCFGQLISPYVTNTLAQGIFGNTSTTNVYIIATIGMAVSAALAIVWKSREAK
ncbi:MAG: MFS transporter [Clostridiales bacterium]|nr:MFS transporter [Clostridiales bacterium]